MIPRVKSHRNDFTNPPGWTRHTKFYTSAAKVKAADDAVWFTHGIDRGPFFSVSTRRFRLKLWIGRHPVRRFLFELRVWR